MTKQAEASITIRATAQDLWLMVSDVTRMGQWSPEAEGAEWLDGATGPAVGARFKGHNRRGKAKWSTTCQVTASEPGRRFAFSVGRPDRPTTRWSYSFEPADDGATTTTESFELVKHLGFGSRLVTRLTTGVRDREADLKEGMVTTLERLKAAAERAPRAGDVGRAGESA